MDVVPGDMLLRIFDFLSLKEKILMREVSQTINSYINPLILRTYKLDKKFVNVFTVERKSSNELTCYKAYNNFTLFIINKQNRVHSLFRINNHYDQCIVDTCREKKLGYIYYHLSQTWKSSIYNKRNIPYCSNCYNYWSI